MVKCLGHQKLYILAIPSMTLGLTLPFRVRYSSSNDGIYVVMVLAFVYMLYCFSLPVFTNNALAFEEVSKTAIMTIYISVGFSSIVMLRDLWGGEYLFVLAFIGAWITDIFAYFTGMLFGKHKLSPVISPKKTIEGSIGGIVLCTICFVLYGVLLRTFFDASVNLLLYAVLGFFASLVSQLGDLIMSAIKRKNNVKDYGTLFPGHGGVLDRFDSVIAVAPVIYLLCLGTFLK